MLFWAFLATTLIYVAVGIACALCLRILKKGVSIIVPFVFLGYGELMVLCGDTIACELINPQEVSRVQASLLPRPQNKVTWYTLFA